MPEIGSLKIKRIKKESPIQFEILIPLIAGAIAIPKSFVELLKIIRDWNLDKEKKRLENENLRLNNQRLKNELFKEANKLLKIEDIKIIKIIEYSKED